MTRRSLDRPAASRGRRRRLPALLGFLVAASIAVPLAWASHQFTDVPDGYPFHAQISAIRGAGITGGAVCTPPGTPPTYCPSELVRRDAMAAFLQRGLGRVAYAGIPLTQLNNPPSSTSLGSLTIDTGGVAGGTGFVRLEATFTARISSNATCPCIAQVMIFDVNAGQFAPVVSMVQLDQLGTYAGSPTGFASGSVSWVKQVATATTYTFGLNGSVQDGTEPIYVHGDFSAEYIPFGSTGTNTL